LCNGSFALHACNNKDADGDQRCTANALPTMHGKVLSLRKSSSQVCDKIGECLDYRGHRAIENRK